MNDPTDDVPDPGPDQAPADAPKSGWKTSEFWAAMAAKAFSLASVLGLLSSADATFYAKSVSGLAVIVFSVASHLLAAHYVSARTALKGKGDEPYA